MRAVWSFWSKPYPAHAHWPSEFDYLLSWALSVQEASRHYPDTWLYTDDKGARYLVDMLGLSFKHVRTDLNSLADHDPDWWALGKIHTYRLQDKPFIHLDNDVFLWLPLPEALLQADVVAQDPEPFTPGAAYYQPEIFEYALARVDGWLPEEWIWYRASHRMLRGECCGIYGGTRIDFIHHVANLAFELIEHHQNRDAVSRLNSKSRLMVVLEQFLLAASLEYHRAHNNSPFHNVRVTYLFDSTADRFNPKQAARTGFTHLLWVTKKNPKILRLLEERLWRDDPAQFERCMKIAHRRMPD